MRKSLGLVPSTGRNNSSHVSTYITSTQTPNSVSQTRNQSSEGGGELAQEARLTSRSGALTVTVGLTERRFSQDWPPFGAGRFMMKIHSSFL